MPKGKDLPLGELDVEAALRTIVEGTATAIGEDFFTELVKGLCQARWVAPTSPATTSR